MKKQMNNESLHIENLSSTIKKLRGPGGCPWDMRQNPVSLKKYLQEELEELLAAIDNDDVENTCEEIGDVLFLLMMLAEMHSEKNCFTFTDSILAIDEKLRRRHPHVFVEKTNLSENELRNQWLRIKEEEKKRKV